MRARMVAPLLWLYDRAARRGLLEHRLARRAFEGAYLAYKRVEAGPVSRLRSFTAPGSTVIDVGANIGFFTLRFGKWVGPAGRVIALEPEGRNAASLRRRVGRARMGSVVECIEAAATDRPGEVRLSLNLSHPGDHRIGAAGVPVRSVRVDDLVDGGHGRVSLVKIDVQGAEEMVVSGARGVIQRHRPVLFIELDDSSLREFGSSAEELIASLLELGYSAHTLGWRGVSSAKTREALAAEAGRGRYVDALFIPRPADG